MGGSGCRFWPCTFTSESWIVAKAVSIVSPAAVPTAPAWRSVSAVEAAVAAEAVDTVPVVPWNRTGCAFKLKIEQARDKTPMLTQVFIEENAAYRHRLHRLNRNGATGFCLASFIEKRLRLMNDDIM